MSSEANQDEHRKVNNNNQPDEKLEQVKQKLTEKTHEYNLLKESFDKEQKNYIVVKEESLQLRIEVQITNIIL